MGWGPKKSPRVDNIMRRWHSNDRTGRCNCMMCAYPCSHVPTFFLPSHIYGLIASSHSLWVAPTPINRTNTLSTSFFNLCHETLAASNWEPTSTHVTLVSQFGGKIHKQPNRDQYFHHPFPALL